MPQTEQYWLLTDYLPRNPTITKAPIMFKTVVLSGLATDAGKTSTVDNLFAPRVANLVRVEIEHANKGSAKQGVTRIRSSQLAGLRSQLIDMENDQNLIVDLGASEYVGPAAARTTARARHPPDRRRLPDPAGRDAPGTRRAGAAGTTARPSARSCRDA